MKPLEKVYWLRLALGMVAALICVGYAISLPNGIPRNPPVGNFPMDYSFLFNSTSLALVTYLVSYYAIKHKFKTVVEKPQKLVTTGIGIYLLSWLVFWILLYTIIAGPPTL
jgi:hypothetical protein